MIRRIATRRFLVKAPHKRIAATALMATALGFGGCAQSPQQQLAVSSHGKEYFPSSIYGAASRRVVADGQPIPRGGGQYLVGKPYTVAGQIFYPSERHIVQVGMASWYGDAFHGRLTANGEIYDRDSFTAAHPTMPLPSYARVTNLSNNYSMIVRVNDRGPYASNRIMDVSRRVAEALDFKRNGTGKVKVEYVGRASLAGSDDSKLFATLRQDAPATWRGEAPTMVAEATPRARVASIEPYAPRPVEPRRAEYIPRRADALERDRATLARLRDADTPRHPVWQDPGEHRGHGAHDSASRGTSSDSALAFAMAEMRRPAAVSPRAEKASAGATLMPPSRPLDLGTIPGAASQIGRHHSLGLRMARARGDDD